MITFLDGPAKGQYLRLKRIPKFLRAVYDSFGGPKGDPKWDALDQVGDQPTASETIYAYIAVGQPRMCFVCGTKGTGGAFPSVDYQYLQPQPTDAAMRDRKSWEQWVDSEAKRRGLT